MCEDRKKKRLRHEVDWGQLKSAFRVKRAVPLGVQVSPAVPEQRCGIIGPTVQGRVLQIAFVFRRGRVRVISARPAHRKERTQYATVARQIYEGL